jgi:beta-glucosidase
MDALQNGDKFRFTVSLRNTGARAGTETVQLYVRDRICSVMRPLRELKAFCKRTLQAGEREDVSFAIGYEELGFYTSDGSYTVEPGAFDIYIGENCLTANMTTIRVTA